MVVIRCKAMAHEEMLKLLVKDIHEQAKDGVIVLPNFCELLNEVPADEEICVKYADGVPLYCTGCKYRELHQHFTETMPNYVFPQTLLCPTLSSEENGPIFCVEWPPAAAEAEPPKAASDCDTCAIKSEYKRLLETGDCNDCGKARTCKYRPNAGSFTRVNCPLWRAKG